MTAEPNSSCEAYARPHGVDIRDKHGHDGKGLRAFLTGRLSVSTLGYKSAAPRLKPQKPLAHWLTPSRNRRVRVEAGARAFGKLKRNSWLTH